MNPTTIPIVPSQKAAWDAMRARDDIARAMGEWTLDEGTRQVKTDSRICPLRSPISTTPMRVTVAAQAERRPLEDGWNSRPLALVQQSGGIYVGIW